MPRTPVISRKDSEIRQIERDLEPLQSRYRTLDRAGYRMKVTFYAFLATLVALTIIGAALGNWFAFGASLVTLILAGIVTYTSRRERWIDLQCRYGMSKNEAMLVEDMVANRVDRLEELTGERK